METSTGSRHLRLLSHFPCMTCQTSWKPLLRLSICLPPSSCQHSQRLSAQPPRESVCCLLVLNSVTSTPQWIRQPEAAWGSTLFHRSTDLLAEPSEALKLRMRRRPGSLYCIIELCVLILVHRNATLENFFAYALSGISASSLRLTP
jgi:hypothetical protein